MTKVLISEKYLHDIANAIRVKLDSQSTYTPAQMAAAIADITGTISGTITPSTDTDKVLVTDSNLTAIANAIRAKLDVATTYTPSQMADAILSIQSAGPTIVSWSTGTDEEVAAMIDAAHNGEIDLQQDGGWAVGDVRTIQVGAFTGAYDVAYGAQNVDIVITSFAEYMSCGNVLQFDFKNSLTTGGAIIDSMDNRGGYGNKPIKTTTLPALANALPEWLKNRLIEFSVLVGSGGYSYESTLQTVGGNKLALRSLVEVTGSENGVKPGEGSLIGYYSDSNNRIKQNVSGNWWTRSPSTNGRNSYYYIASNGSQSTQYPSGQYGIAPFGCL